MSANKSNKSMSMTLGVNTENTSWKLVCTLIIIIIICIAISKYAFINGVLTCNHYVLSTFLYVKLAFFLMYLIVLLNDKYGICEPVLNLLFNYVLISFIILCILLFGLSYVLHTTPANEIAKSNGIWVLLICMLGVLIIPIIYIGRIMNVINKALYITIILVTITGLLGYFYGDKIITFDWDYYLYIALVILIIISILGGLYFIYNSDIIAYVNFIYVLSLLIIIIFTLLLLSNYKKLRENADNCDDGKVIPNFPVESFSIIIKIYNIFTKLIQMLGIRKMFGGKGKLLGSMGKFALKK